MDMVSVRRRFGLWPLAVDFPRAVRIVLLLQLLAWSALPVAADDWPDWGRARELHPGIRLAQTNVQSPRPMWVHAVRIDLRTPGLRFYTTPRADGWEENKRETIRQTTRDFLRGSRNTDRPMVFAVNGDGFSPWPAPWNVPTPTNLGGLAISDGVVVSPASGSPSLLITKSGTVSIITTTADTKIDDVQVAVSGLGWCLRDGVPQPSGQELHPRTGIGLSKDRRYLIVIAIDGRRASRQGATIHELGQWMARCGADDAMNMDGGGSTTLAWWNPMLAGDDKTELINTPVGNGAKYETPLAEMVYVPTERANGNHLGVYYAEADSPRHESLRQRHDGTSCGSR